METLKFKTNINCGGCLAKVTPKLNEQAGENCWSVDTDNPDKILSVSAEVAEQDKIIAAVNAVGFRAERIA
ncbi:heavy-metal-associated domain-containing protein [Flavobacterium sp.]|uniref:heavy-metal-associated domain-containing protein n=1 Tax=Flavobacterium sp. TaxID=239 RepID=UPI000BFF8E8E|nr:hypothetical protein VF13_38295 [Nostoc linckia z16]